MSNAESEPNSQNAIATVATAVIIIAELVPMWRALLRAFVSVESPPFTRNEPRIEASMPTKAMAMGNDRREMLVVADACSAPSPRAKATSEIGAMIEPA